MQEKFKREILNYLSTYLPAKHLRKVDETLDVVLTRYELKETSTELIVYQGGVPSEVKSFLVSKSIKGLSKETLQHYYRTLIHFTNNMVKDIKEVKTNDVRLYLLTYEQTRKVSKSTMDDKRRILNSFYNWLVREEIILNSPMLRIDPIKTDKQVRDPLTSVELEQMRNACETVRETALLEMLYSTGCRISELVGMNKRDLDFNTGRVKVFGKGSKERYCFINAKAELAIKKYIFTRIDDQEALFVATKKPYNRLGKGTIQKEIRNLGKRAGINRGVYPHLIRHTTATHMLNRGAKLEDVQIVLGHENIGTTQIYAKQDLDNVQLSHKKYIV